MRRAAFGATYALSSGSERKLGVRDVVAKVCKACNVLRKI